MKNTEEIWNEFSNKLKNFIKSKVSNDSDSEDILQDVFIKIHSNIETLKDNNKIHSWIYQIARNSIIDYYRSKKIKQELIENDIKSENDNSENLEDALSPFIKLLVNSLPEKYKDVLFLSEYEKLSSKEISVKLGLSQSAVKSRILRGRNKIKDLLLECCHFELDKFGKILDYYPKQNCCNCKR